MQSLNGRDIVTQVIFYEQDWNPQADKQALQRAHRMGQISPVLAINLITPHTIEEVSVLEIMAFNRTGDCMNGSFIR